MRSDIRDKFNTQHLDNREYVLMANIRTESELDIIPSDYVLEYTKKLDDVSSLKIEIPNVVKRGEEKIKYPLYDKVQGKQFIVVKKDGVNEERFIIESVTEAITNDVCIKTITANSYENTLKTKTCLINEGMTRQLYRPENETLDVADGILNIFEQQTGWTVAHCDDLARKETIEENISVSMNITDGVMVAQKVTDDLTLVDRDITVPSEENFALTFDIAWKGLTITNSDNTEYKAESIIHTFVDLPCGVTHLVAKFTSNSEERYGMTYILTLEDGSEYIKTYPFVNCRGLMLTVNGMSLVYITSVTETKSVVKYRFLEHQSTYWYQYLKTTVQEAYGCYIFFDSFNKTISVYDQPTQSAWKGFHLDFDNLLTKINKTPKVEDICTRLWVQSNNVDITEANPLGTSYLEDYSYFINNGSMSDTLKDKLNRYYTLIDKLQEQWIVLKNDKNATDQLLVKKNAEVVSINQQIKAKNAILTAFISAQGDKVEQEGTNQERIANEIKALQDQLTALLNSITDLQAQSDLKLAQMQDLGRQMSKEFATDDNGKIFVQLDLDELNDFTIEQTYTDDVHTKANSLYKYAQDLMKDKASLKYSFTLEHSDLVKGIKHPLGWQWYIELGAKVEINDKDIADKDGFVTIYAYTYSPKNQTISSVDFNNNTKVIEAVAGLGSIGKLVHQTASMTDFWKSTWRDAESANAIVSDIRKNGLDLAANAVRGGTTVNKVSMTEAGLFVIDANNENNQIYIGASLIALTDDRWIHSKTAIDTGGVIADTLVGRLILGENMIIGNDADDPTFQILPNGLTIRDDHRVERIQMGLGDKNPYFNLGTKDMKNYLLFNEDGTLDIKASSFKIQVGDTTSELIGKNEVQNIINQIADERMKYNRNLALDTIKGSTLQGNGSTQQVFPLAYLSRDGSYLANKEVTLSFNWEYHGTGTPTFYVRTGDGHNQKLIDTISASSTDNKGKASKTSTILAIDGKNFDEIELVASNLTGSLDTTLLKFEEGKVATVWTQAPEDNDYAYTILLSNESQIIATDGTNCPITTGTYETEVLIYQGTAQQTDFTIAPIQANYGITPSISGTKVIFSVNENTPLTADQGRFEINITVDNKQYKKIWTWAVAKQNTSGSVSVTGDQVFRYTNNFSGTPYPNHLTLVATKNGLDMEGKWQFKNTDGIWADYVVDGSVVIDTTLRVYPTDYNYADANVKMLQIRYIAGIASDEVTTYKVSDGTNGIDGNSTYIHVHYSAYLDGTNMTTVPQQDTVYIGTYVDSVNIDSDNPSDYNWVKFVGTDGQDGTDGIPGRDGVDGQTTYFHIKYSDDGLTFTKDPQGKLPDGEKIGKWIGTYTDFNEEDSTVFSDYDWVKFVGEDGIDGSHAETVVITGEQVFKYSNNFEGLPTPSSIKISSTVYNFTNPRYAWFFKRGGEDGWNEITGAESESITISHDDATIFNSPNVKTVTIKCQAYTDYDEAFDELTIAKISDGKKGDKGDKGDAGNNAKYIIVTGDQTFKYKDDYNILVEPQSILLTATRYNIDEEGMWQYKASNGNWIDLGSTDLQYTVTPDTGSFADGATSLNIRYRAVVGTEEYYDVLTIMKVTDGRDGTDGTDGIDGVDGTSNFFHIKYCDNPTGIGMTDLPTETSTYMGTCVTTSQESPTDHTLYNWSLIKGTDGTTIVNIREQYYLSTSQQTLINGSWVDSAPTWKTGKYIWTRTVFTYNNNTEVTTDPICVTGKDGADGLNGGVSVSGVDIFYYQSTSATQLIGGEWQTVSPTWQNGKYVWSKTITYLDNGFSYESEPICLTGEKGQNGTDGIPGRDGIDGKTSYLHIKYSNDAGLTFTGNGGEDLGIWIGTYVDFIKADSTNVEDYTWKKYVGDDGIDGEDAYTVILTNENHTFPSDYEGNIASAITTTTTAIAYKGMSPATATIGNLPSVNGLTLTKSGSTVTIKANTGKNLATNGNFTIPVIVDGQTFNRVFSFNKTKDGKDGQDGIKGADGTSSYFYIRYSANSNGNPMTTAPQETTQYIGVCSTTSSTAPTSYSSYQWSKIKGTDGKDGIPGTKGTDGKTSYLHIKYSNDGQTFTPNNGEGIGTWIGTYVDYTEADSTTFSKYSWKRYVGTDGQDGADGEDAYTVILTNENHAFPTDANGKITAEISTTTQVIAYKGTAPITPTIGTLPTVNGLALSKSGTTITIKASVGTSMAESGNINIPITVDGKSFTKVFSYCKARQGANGANAKLVTVTGDQVFKYSNNFSGTPTPETIVLKAIVLNTTETGKWQYMETDDTWTDYTKGGTLVTSKTIDILYNSKIFGTTDAKSMRLRYYISDSLYDEITLVKISDGAKGTDGKNGIDGINGKDGVSTYFYVRYSANANGSNMTSTPSSSSLYIGVCSTTSATAPTSASSYQWTLIKGSDGKDGTPGAKGDNGQTSYLHIKYSNDGKTFTSNNGEDLGKWIGTYVDFNQADSTSFGSYTWSKYVGEDGQDGTDGTDGTDAYTIILTNEAQTIPTTSSRVPMSASTYSTDIVVYQGTTKRTDFTLGTINSANGITVAKPSSSKVNFTVSTGTALSADNGTFTIPITIDGKTFNKLFSWSCSKQGNKGDKGDTGNDGTPGADAYTVILTNENHTFNADQNGSISSAISTTTQVIAYKGAKAITPTIETLPSVTGLTLTKSGTTVTIQANTGTSLAANGSFDIPITVDGKSFTKKFSWTKINKGTNAYSASIGATSQVFKSMDGGKTYTPDNIVLTPILQNLSFSKWQYSTNGGSSFTDVASGSNGLTVSSNKLTIAKTSPLFTTSVSSIVFKLITNNSSYYDTMTVVKLNDIAELEIGGRNYIRNGKGDKKLGLFKNFTTINENEGYGEITLTSKKTYVSCDISNGFVLGCRDYVVGKKMVFSYDIMYTKWDFPNGSNRQEFWIGQRYTNNPNDSNATGTWKQVTQHNLPVVGQNGCELNKWYHVSQVLTIPTQADEGVNTVSSIQFYNSNADVSASVTMRFKNVKLEYGNIETDWSPAPEDGTDYTDELIDDLRKTDIANLIALNKASTQRIDEILSDSVITPNEKVELQYELAKALNMRDNAISFYNTVNDTSMVELLNSMKTAYTNLDSSLTSVLSNMTTNTSASNSGIKNSFKTFYECYEELITALQKAVAIISISNSTSIEAMEKKIALTATTTEQMATTVNEMSSHLDFSQQGFVEIYATTNGVKGRFLTQITDQKLAFKDNGMEVAYISNQEMYITKATITNQLQIANFIIKPSGTASGGVIFIHTDNA